MRPRYYCDHCNKGNGSPSAMRRHERGCTLNPQRVCGMCKMLADEGGPEPAPPRDELVRIMDADGFKAMCAAANDCPACILAALRTKNSSISDYDGEGQPPPRVYGPDDGRSEWEYKQAKTAWWAAWNSAAAERNYPGY
jgi:hypothetical protein